MFQQNGALQSKLDAAKALYQTLIDRGEGVIFLDPSGLLSPSD